MESNTVNQSNIISLPQMPLPIQKLTAKTPWFVIERVVDWILNQLFKPNVNDGSLSFLIDKKLAINLTDSGIKFVITSNGNRILVQPQGAKADLTLSGSVYAMMLLMSQQADADGLFFKRQLASEGDTELGLYVKNFLESIDPDESKMHQFSQSMSQQILRLIDSKKRLFSQLRY